METGDGEIVIGKKARKGKTEGRSERKEKEREVCLY